MKPTAWMKAYPQSSTPDGPNEHEVDVIYGEDAPDENWRPLYSGSVLAELNETISRARTQAIDDCIKVVTNSAAEQQRCYDTHPHGLYSHGKMIADDIARALEALKGEAS